MIRLLDSLRLRKKSLVRARFEERARHFDETLMFLEAVGWVTESAESLALTDSGLASVRWPADANTTRRITEAILTSNTPYRTQFCQFLGMSMAKAQAALHGRRPARTTSLRPSLALLPSTVF